MPTVLDHPPSAMQQPFPAELSSAGLARRYVRQALAAIWTSSDFIDNVVLLASEFTTNAIKAMIEEYKDATTRPHIAVSIMIAPGELFLVVYDCAPGGPVWIRPADPDDESGRGLEIAWRLGATVTFDERSHGQKRIIVAIPLTPVRQEPS